ncbi:MAG: type II toxin-antitoxin system PemK/MazF family toxin [Candidatus Moraniibacteriota bacterium]
MFFHETEVWFCHLGINIGHEEAGKGDWFLRPVLILKKFNDKVFWAIPLTKTFRTGKYYYSFYFKDNKSTAILSQIRLLDAKRLRYKVGKISKKNFFNIKQKIKQLLA